MRKSAIFLMLLTVLAKIFGFARDVTLSYFYGASSISDAYLIAMTIPVTIFTFVGTGIATSYIPMYVNIEKENSKREADQFTTNVVNITLLICTVLVIMILLFAVPVVKLFASGFEGKTLELAVSLTRISIFGIYFSGLVYVFSGYLQIKNNFAVPALIGIPMNLIVLLSVIMSAKYSIAILGLGKVLAVASQLLYLIPFIRRMGYSYKFQLNINDANVKKMVLLAIPVIIGVSVNQINVLVDRTIASQLAVGGISALNYADRLNQFVQGIFVASVATVIYPRISRMAVEGNISELKALVSEAISVINLILIPVAVGSMIFCEPIVKLLFSRGAFDANAEVMTSQALFWFSIGMVGFGVREILARVFYSLHDTKTPMINAAVAMAMNIILNIILSRILGIAGLALATSISAVFCAALLFISLRKKIGSFGIKSLLSTMFKVIVASSLMGSLASYAYKMLISQLNSNISLVISIGVGLVVYIVLIYILRIKEARSLVSLIKQKLKKKDTRLA